MNMVSSSIERLGRIAATLIPHMLAAIHRYQDCGNFLIQTEAVELQSSSFVIKDIEACPPREVPALCWQQRRNVACAAAAALLLSEESAPKCSATYRVLDPVERTVPCALARVLCFGEYFAAFVLGSRGFALIFVQPETLVYHAWSQKKLQVFKPETLAR